MSTLVNLKALVLRNNNLIGEFPSTLKNCSNLIVVDVSENILAGPIPPWIGESMKQLIILNMRGNNFSGNIPNRLCYLKSIQLLDLSWNKLSKGIPACLKNFTAMSEKRSRSDNLYDAFGLEVDYRMLVLGDYEFDIAWMWKGVKRGFKIPRLFPKTIDLSSNNLTGEIPKEIGYLLGLVSLNLSRNNLSGEIPSEIGNLSSLESLDLSRNHLHGRISPSLSQLDFLGKLDLSYNSLSGRIPLGQLQTFEASSFEGNIDLCGQQLNKICPGDGDQATGDFQEAEAINRDEDSVFYEKLYVSMGLGYFTGFWGFLGPILLWRSWRNAYIQLLNRLTSYIHLRI